MIIHGEKMENLAIVKTILHYLASKFDYIVCLIEEFKDRDALLLDELFIGS